jgi:hypothetical protein
MRHGMMLVLLLTSPLCAQSEDAVKREQIGEVLGKPVYRDEIRTGKGRREQDELHRLLSAPVMEKYCETHKANIEPTQAELDTATKVFDRRHSERIRDKVPKLREELRAIENQLAADGLTEQQRTKLEVKKLSVETRLQPPGRDFAEFVLGNWKLQRHLYDKYGGGRVLWQQAGLEAFDAMHEWLKSHEKKGDFRITDPKLRAEFYEYWTRSHGPFMIEEPERIRTEFLEPEWAPKKAASKAP